MSTTDDLSGDRVVHVDGYGTAAVQAALDRASAGGGIVVNNQAGTHFLSTHLWVHPHTRFLSAPGVRYVRDSADMSALCVLFSDGTVGDYGATGNVVIQGGDWDCQAAQFGSSRPCSGIVFGHAHRVTISDLVIRGVSEYHGLGIHGSQQVVIERCEFHDQVSGRSASEAIQVDAMYSAGAFGHYGPYDDTMCDGVTVRDCLIDGSPDGIGSHNGPDGHTHHNIRIENTIIRRVSGLAIHPRQWDNVVIDGNRIDGCHRAILVTAEASPPARYGFRIVNNHITNAVATSDGVVWIKGGAAASAGRVSGNWITGAPCDGVTIGGGNTDWVLTDNDVEVDEACLYAYDADRVTIANNRALETATGGGYKGAILARAGSTSVMITGNSAAQIDASGTGTSYVLITGNITGRPITTDGSAVVVKHHNIEAGTFVP